MEGERMTRALSAAFTWLETPPILLQHELETTTLRTSVGVVIRRTATKPETACRQSCSDLRSALD
jgi:hypothetical protein